jgi:shikimate kinase
MEKDRFFLVGFMGSGKSTVGPLLAKRLGWPFLDLDSMIEDSFGGPVHRIFSQHGEPFFRQMERDGLRNLEQWKNCVAALGGGAFVDPENRLQISRLGLSVFLDLPLEGVLERCPPDGTRPLLKDPASVRELYYSRLPLYRLSDFEVDASLPPDTIVGAILETARLQPSPRHTAILPDHGR